MIDLPSMKEGEGGRGKWKTHRAKDLTFAQLKTLVERFSQVSMVRVKYDFDDGQLFYPFPFRLSDGAVNFGRHGEGIYMRDEILAMLDWCACMPLRSARAIEFKGAQEFIPGNDEKPFTFVQELFDMRSRLVAESERTGVPDIREKVIKLVLNSLYGRPKPSARETMASRRQLRTRSMPPQSRLGRARS